MKKSIGKEKTLYQLMEDFNKLEIKEPFSNVILKKNNIPNHIGEEHLKKI